MSTLREANTDRKFSATGMRFPIAGTERGTTASPTSRGLA